MSVRLRHVFFDDEGRVHTIDQAQFSRMMDPRTREALPELAERRVRFLTLYISFEDDKLREVFRVEAEWVTLDREGRRDQAEADRQTHAVTDLLGERLSLSNAHNVIPASALFQVAGSRWKPTSKEIEAAISVHRLRE